MTNYNKYTYIQSMIIGGLESTLHILDKANVDMLTASLAPDMFNFTRQIQVISDSAKGAMAKLSSSEAPSMPDNESSIEELRQRIEKTLSYVKTFNETSFKDADSVQIKFAWLPNKYITSEDYVNKFLIPNYMFHIVTAYNILRMKGINIGKMDFIGDLTMHDIV